VREDRGYWVDRSGPGEPADYGRWPPPKQEIEHASAKVVSSALADLEALRDAFVLPSSGAAGQASALAVKDAQRGHREERERARREPVLEPEAEGDDDMSAETVEQIRRQALDAIRGL
jgi:hypothetical protein